MEILSLIVPAVALTTAIPDLADCWHSPVSIHQYNEIASRIVAAVAGMIVQQKTEFNPLEHYNTVG